MHVNIRKKFGKKLNIIYPGECYVTTEDEFIGTLLGSCVSICLHDPENGVGGMNHFMLPGKISNDNLLSDNNAKYGINAINELITKMIRKGASRRSMTAKIFGGGNILKSLKKNVISGAIPADNIRVAKVLLEIEDIPIAAIDVGEDYTRKIIFAVSSGKVYLRKMRGGEIKKVVSVREGTLFSAERIGFKQDS